MKKLTQNLKQLLTLTDGKDGQRVIKKHIIMWRIIPNSKAYCKTCGKLHR